MSDDHASNAISLYGSRLAKDAPTPHIDRIGQEGACLTNCHCVNSICTPSRANILTGQHSNVNGVKTLADSLSDDSTLLSELLQAGGYHTAIFGKWHVNARPRGFDDWAVLPGQGRYHNPDFYRSESTFLPGEVPHAHQPSTYGASEPSYGVHRQVNGYVTDVITDITLDWLEHRRDHEKPFFLCCHHKAPHDAFEYDRQYKDIYQDTSFEEPDTLFEQADTLNEISRRYGSTVSERWEKRNMVRLLQSPNYPNGQVDFSGLDFNARAKKAYQHYMQDYLRTVHSIDENVGRILDYLDANNLTENTLIIYTSDQGMMLGEHDKIDKRWIFDESQRMPFLIRYPQEIPADQTCDDMVDNLDFAPTLLDYAGLSIPESMQGRSFRRMLKDGAAPAGWRQSVYYRYWMHMAHHWVPAHYGIRTKTHKLVFFYGMKLDCTGCNGPDCDSPTEPGFELYDLQKDPFETTNVFAHPAYKDVAERLKTELLQIKAFYGDTDDAYPQLQALQRQMWRSETLS